MGRMSINRSLGPTGGQRRVDYVERTLLDPCGVLTSVYPLRHAKSHDGPCGRRLKGSGTGYREAHRVVSTGPQGERPKRDATQGLTRIIDGDTVKWV